MNAAAAKLVAPERLATALRQLAPASIAGWIGLDGEGTGASIARTAAGVEAAAAVGLLVPEVQVPNGLGVQTSAGIFCYVGDWRRVMFNSEVAAHPPLRPLRQ